ncbi:hypothetical protein ASH04_23770 [Rhodococcus sp. Leaf233]|nr:hypothetical protein ASH04_23770 [Rhodococcus sp. Leaf233]
MGVLDGSSAAAFRELGRRGRIKFEKATPRTSRGGFGVWAASRETQAAQRSTSRSRYPQAGQMQAGLWFWSKPVSSSKETSEPSTQPLGQIGMMFPSFGVI